MWMKLARCLLVAVAARGACGRGGWRRRATPAAGEKVFKKCAACHSLSPDGKSKVGPDLYGVVGRTTGTLEGFKYSEVMIKAGEDGHVWTEEELAIYLESPKRMLPGTKMTFVGLKKPEERADVIAYIKQVSAGG